MTRRVKRALTALASAACLIAFIKFAVYPSFERAELRSFTATLADDGQISILAIRESGYRRPSCDTHFMRLETEERVQETRVFLTRWSPDKPDAPSSVRLLALIPRTPDEVLAAAIGGDGPPAALVWERSWHDGSALLSSWEASDGPAGPRARLEVDRLLCLSGGGTKFLAWLDGKARVGETRSLKLATRVSPALDALLDQGKRSSYMDNAWLSDDARYVVVRRSGEMARYLRLEGIDLENELVFSLDFASDAEYDPQLVGSEGGEFRFIVKAYFAQGERTEYRILDKEGRVARILSLEHTPTLWDVATGRFLAVDTSQAHPHRLRLFAETGPVKTFDPLFSADTLPR